MLPRREGADETQKARDDDAEERAGKQTRGADTKKINWWEYAIRFAFGGLITVAAGLIARAYGPVVGGLFLAFPAILPASVTLVKKHHGEDSAGVDALGAALGSVGLIAFGAVVWLFGALGSPGLVLAGATVAWFAVATALWFVFRRRIEANE